MAGVAGVAGVAGAWSVSTTASSMSGRALSSRRDSSFDSATKLASETGSSDRGSTTPNEPTEPAELTLRRRMSCCEVAQVRKEEVDSWILVL